MVRHQHADQPDVRRDNETHVGAAYWVFGTHSTPLGTLT